MVNNTFGYFSFFYRYLRYRIFIFFVLSFLVGLLDGLGLALFIPLLQLVAEDKENPSEEGGFISDLIIDVLQIPITLFNILLLIFIFFSLKGVIKLLEGYCRVVYQQYFMRSIRVSNIDLLSGFAYEKFAKMDAGRIQNTFSGEVGKVNKAFRYFFKAFQYSVLVLIYVVLAFAADPVFSLIVTAGGIGIHLLFKMFYAKTRDLSIRLTKQAHQFEGLLMQKVSFFNYLKTTGLNLMYSKKLKQNIIGLEKDQRRIGLIDAFLNALREPLVILVVIIAIYLQLQLFEEDIALILFSLLLLYRGLTFFMAVQEQWNMFLGLSGSLENIQDFILQLEEEQEQNGNVSFEGFRDKLILQDISFSYDHEKNVLEKINLEINKNETFAFIGESGSGKSTLMRLISGLLLPVEGEYYVDQVPVRNLDLYSFRNKIGYVPQEVPVFSDSIYNNVTFWAPKTPENLKKFDKALVRSSIEEFVREQPMQEETLLGNNGINLSGGQKQRLAIARELYKEVDFLFLDEATSALDGETEAVIQENIRELKGQLTIVIIAHRLATVKFADQIVLLNDGKIEDKGSFKELLEKSEHFRKLVEIQNN